MTNAATPLTEEPPAPRRRRLAMQLVDQGFVSAVNFLTIVILARRFTLDVFGVFMIAQTVLLLVTTAQNALVAHPHNILGPQRTGLNYTRLTFVLGVMQFSLSFILSIVIAFIGVVLHWRGNDAFALTAYALAISVLPCTGQEFVRRVLYTQNDIVGATINNFVSYGLQLSGILIVATQLGGIEATAPNAIFALGLSSLVATALGIWQLRQQLAPRVLALLPERRSLRAFGQLAMETWRLSKWLMAQQLVTWLGASGYGFLLAGLLGPASFGAYRAAYQVVNVLNPIRQAAMNHLPSRAARVFAAGGTNALSTWVKRTTWALTLPFLACAALVVMGTAPLVELMYGTNLQLPYLHAVVAGGVLSYCINFARTPLDYAVLVGGGARALFLRSLILTAFAWTVGFLLIWVMGILGAAIAEVIGALIATALSLRIYAAMTSADRAKQLPGEPIATGKLATPMLESAQRAASGFSIHTSGSIHP